MTALLLLASVLAVQTNYYSLIKSTVSTADGQPFYGAKATVIRTDVDARQQKKSRREGYSDHNGEVAFRLEVGPAKFRLTIEAKGFKTEVREIEVFGDERADFSVVLKK